MQLSVGLPSFASETHALPPEAFRRYARLAAEYDFSGAWLIDHYLKPPTYSTSMLDPLVTLSFVAGETETLPVGTSILSLPLRDPVLVAKRAATLQHLSGQRVTLGLGTGYVDAEYDAVGVPIEERSRRYLEGIELIRRLFDEDTVTFEGEFYSVDGLRLEPSSGRPPRILAGGGGVDVEGERRVATSVKKRLLHADGWIAPPRSPNVLEHDWAAFSEFLESEGRDPGTADKVVLQYLHLEPGHDEEQVRRRQQKVYGGVVGTDRSVEAASANWLTGTVDEVTATLAEYERQGFDEVILHPMVRTYTDLDRQLRLYRELLCPEFP